MLCTDLNKNFMYELIQVFKSYHLHDTIIFRTRIFIGTVGDLIRFCKIYNSLTVKKSSTLNLFQKSANCIFKNLRA